MLLSFPWPKSDHVPRNFPKNYHFHFVYFLVGKKTCQVQSASFAMTFFDPNQNSTTFQAWKMKLKNPTTFQVFHDPYETCFTCDKKSNISMQPLNFQSLTHELRHAKGHFLFLLDRPLPLIWQESVELLFCQRDRVKNHVQKPVFTQVSQNSTHK